MTTALAKEQPEPRKYVLCEGGCNTGFTVPYKEWHPEADQVCPSCQAKRNRLAMLRIQLAAARRFGHTTPGETCEMCALQNQIDDVIHNGYDWREDHERRLENLPQHGSGEPI